MIVILQRAPEGLWPAITRTRVRKVGAGPLRSTRRIAAAADCARRDSARRAKVTKRFGGLVAVDRMSLRCAAGEIVALIGPNGAGKTTMFNVISGGSMQLRAQVSLRGRDVTGSESRDIASWASSRTFQQCGCCRR